MKKIYLLLSILLSFPIMGQNKLPAGYPDRTGREDIKKNFMNPPKGYGEVPFYWWMGDTLTREHLSMHLDLMAGKKVTSLQINYAHSDRGGINWGLTFPSKPELFSEEWWELFGWFMAEAKKRDMTVSLSDYTLGVGQGWYVDDALKENPDLTGYELKFSHQEVTAKYKKSFEQIPLSLFAYQLDQQNRIISGKETDLLPYIKENRIEWNTPDDKWLVTEVQAIKKEPSLDPMHPLSGESYVRHFFQKFEDRFPELSKGGLNFFFSDELDFHLRGYLWNSRFGEEFRKRKGYDMTPWLAGLFTDIGDMTPKIRMDYNDVMVSLSKENFFIPVYNWHAERNLIYGCDHGGRGLDVAEFGDYFRTQRWNQAPGCDQPNLGKDIIKNKVASSIAHLYERPRVWLEGFYVSGWGTTTAGLTDAIFANFAMGQNVLSLHGLYYSTVGGWWEWAPPCNHHHMPYWNQMSSLLECTERLSYLLSQGYHQADIAILYPVEPVVAGYGDESVKQAFSIGEHLYRHAIDFDYMDYESLDRAKIKNSMLHISGEQYKILIIPSMKAIRHSSLEKIDDFVKQGGIIINIGDMPEATEKYGRNNKQVQTLVDKIVNSPKGKVYKTSGTTEVIAFIDWAITRDFKSPLPIETNDYPCIQHRKIGEKHLYAVYNLPKGTPCFFRMQGSVELWNPWDGTTQQIAVSAIEKEGTVIKLPLEKEEIQIFVFDPSGKPVTEKTTTANKPSDQIILEGEWAIEQCPVLDNRFGDFHWPATDELMGAYIHKARYTCQENAVKDWISPSFNDQEWEYKTFSYGTKFKLLGAIPGISEHTLLTHLPEQSEKIVAENNTFYWQDYDFSWRWGVENDYGHQGYHGLKAEITDNFIRLGDIEQTWTSMKRVADKNGYNHYYLWTRIEIPESGTYVFHCGEILPATIYIDKQRVKGTESVFLSGGTHELLLHYNTHGTTYFVIRPGQAIPGQIPEVAAERPLTTTFRGDLSVIPFDIRPDKKPGKGYFRFYSAPD
ncbi:MAG: hypothetical protein LUE98_05385 [Tannerellaceae bacterium]|nr:hypothetical protein [Tannerellaceae bacterium]